MDLLRAVGVNLECELPQSRREDFLERFEQRLSVVSQSPCLTAATPRLIGCCPAPTGLRTTLVLWQDRHCVCIRPLSPAARVSWCSQRHWSAMGTPPRLPTIGFACARLLRLLLSTLHLHRTTGFREVVSFPPPGFYSRSVSDMVQCPSSTRQLRQPLTSLAFASFCGCFYLKPSTPSIRLTKMVPQLPRSPIFDQPKHPSVLLITAPHRFTAPLPYSSSRHVAYPTPPAHKRPVVACDEADKLSHVLHVLTSHLPEPFAASTMTTRIVHPLNLTSCAHQSKPERPLNFAFPCSKLPTPCDFAWLCWCGLTFNLPKLWTGLLLRPPELGHSAHR